MSLSDPQDANLLLSPEILNRSQLGTVRCLKAKCQEIIDFLIVASGELLDVFATVWVPQPH